MWPTLDQEKELRQQGHLLVAGVDEVGRGPIAGPVVAAAAILPENLELDWLSQVRDSKLISAKTRDYILGFAINDCRAIGVGIGSVDEINTHGIAATSLQAMIRAVDSLPIKPNALLIDFFPLPECGIPYRNITRGDMLCVSIATASIIAKVTRDRLMVEADHLYPGYNFSRHKGYATANHLRLLQSMGPSPIHRNTFKPVNQLLP